MEQVIAALVGCIAIEGIILIILNHMIDNAEAENKALRAENEQLKRRLVCNEEKKWPTK